MPSYRHKRGTLAQITASAAASGLKVGEVYFLTDLNRLAVASAVNAFVQVAGLADIGGGSDPWTYVKLAADFTTSSASAVDVTGLAFTPLLNTQYEFEATLFLRTATATVGPRPGLAWPTGMTDGVARILTPSSATAFTTVNGNISAALLAAVGGLPNTTASFHAEIKGSVRAGASPAGTVKVQMASETAGTNVTVKAGSFLKYRTI